MSGLSATDQPPVVPNRGLAAAVRRWLKRWTISGPGRDRRQEPERIVAALDLRPGQRVADLGSGSGYFTHRLARAVSPGGRVYAVDTDTDMLWFVRGGEPGDGAEVVPVLAQSERLSLAEPVDMLFVSHSYHHLPNRVRYLAEARDRLRDGGRVAIVEARPEGLFHRMFGHAIEPDRLRAEMEEAGYRLSADHDFPAGDSFMIFAPHPAAREA